VKLSEIRELDLASLEARVRELKVESFRLKIRLYTGQLDKPSVIRPIRQEIARVKTVITEKKAEETKTTAEGSKG
jgi:large subunit ribosomal protein L29